MVFRLKINYIFILQEGPKGPLNETTRAFRNTIIAKKNTPKETWQKVFFFFIENKLTRYKIK